MLHLFNLRQFINGFLFRDCTFVVVHELCERVMLKFLLSFLETKREFAKRFFWIRIPAFNTRPKASSPTDLKQVFFT